MKRLHFICILLILVLLGGALAFYLQMPQKNSPSPGAQKPVPTVPSGPDKAVTITTFEECVASGALVRESYPRQCQTDDGRVFTEIIVSPKPAPEDAPKKVADMIRVTTPQPNQEITSPLAVTGTARGQWFFEASFPVKLLDDQGKQIAVAVAQAEGEWMTTEFVPFKATLTFTVPAEKKGKKGMLVLEKDNPSGLPEHDAKLEIPVMLK